MQKAPDVEPDDPYRWLEDVAGDGPLAWSRQLNAETQERYATGERFAALRDEIREVLDSDERIPYVTRRGAYRYNFWRDADHPRGLWRRTTLEEYRTDCPRWEILLDVDALAEREGENWVWAGARCLRPDYRLALISLSRGGADAKVVREFDLEAGTFVAGGFELPEAKSRVDWIDADHVFVGTDFGPGSLTTSGYPRTARRWRRGTPLAQAETVFEGEAGDVGVSAVHDDTEGFERDFVFRGIEFYRSRLYLLAGDGDLRLIDVPEDAVTDVHREWLLVQPRTPWVVEGTTYPPGCLVAARFDDYLAGRRELTVLFTPDAHTSLGSYSWTRHHLVLNLLHDVTSRVVVLTPDRLSSGRHVKAAASRRWRERELGGVPPLCTVVAEGTDPDVDDEYELHVTGFTTPSTVSLGTLGGPPAEIVKARPPAFDAAGMEVSQHFARSDDGTLVPYFVVTPPGPAPADGWPTLLWGYGGFRNAIRPAYNAALGRGWLARGGCYAVANIRGGAEYGPDWHRAALREKRPRAYEDFAAVARDLAARGVTTPGRLGVQGRSNGGLLTGVMLTRYPDLFGAVVVQVPLADMRRYHVLLAGASWMAEYGNPDEEADWAFLRDYSPYHQLRADRRYPPALFTTSTRDDRVHPAHARKMVARLREFGHEVSYYENIEGGHVGAADNAQQAFVSALVYEFLWQRLGDG